MKVGKLVYYFVNFIFVLNSIVWLFNWCLCFELFEISLYYSCVYKYIDNIDIFKILVMVNKIFVRWWECVRVSMIFYFINYWYMLVYLIKMLLLKIFKLG